MEALERISSSNDLLTLILMLALLLLVLAKNLFPHRFEDFISLFRSEKYLMIKNKEHKALYGFNILMLTAHILIISVLLFTIIRYFSTSPLENEGVLLLRVITAYGFFVLLKFTVEKIIANVFDIDETIDHYLFQKHTYRNFVTLIILPVALFLVYRQNQQEFFLYILLGIVIAATAITFFKILNENHDVVSRNWFYFILYLCALEITPYIILYKLIRVS